MKKLVAVFACFACMLILTCSAFASDFGLVKIPDSNDIPAITKLVGADYSGIDDTDFRSWFKCSGGYLYYDTDLDSMGYSLKVQVMRDFTLAISDLCEDEGISNITRQAVYTKVSENMGDEFLAAIPGLIEATSANIWAGLAWFAPFQSWFSTFLGFLVIAVIMFLVATTIIDLVYIGIPRFTEWLLTDSTRGKKIRWVSTDAYDVIRESAEGSNKNVYFMYFKKRFVTYIVLFVCILYLLTNQIAGLIGWFLDYAQVITG